MVIKYKMFPYPVLTDFTDDYSDSKFEVTIEKSQYGFDFSLFFMVTLKNDGLQELITEGKAEFVYHLECSQTTYRKAVTTDKKVYNLQMSHKDVCGKLQICPFIVAKEDIHAYTNSSFHTDYAGTTFEIEAGCVLAIAAPREVIIEKYIDDLARIPSIKAYLECWEEYQKCESEK